MRSMLPATDSKSTCACEVPGLMQRYSNRDVARKSPWPSHIRLFSLDGSICFFPSTKEMRQDGYLLG